MITAIRFVRLVTHSKELLSLKSQHPPITWSCKITWQIKFVNSLLRQGFWPFDMSSCDLLWVISDHKVTQPFKKVHSGHWGINPPLKNNTPSFLPSPPPPWINKLSKPPPPFLKNPLLLIDFLWSPRPPLPEKSDLSVNPKNIKVFHP